MPPPQSRSAEGGWQQTWAPLFAHYEWVTLAGAGVAAGIAVMLGLVGGFLFSALGLLMVAAGQQISCFVAIERNTRTVIALLDTQGE